MAHVAGTGRARPGPQADPHVAAMLAAGVSRDQQSRWAAAGHLGVSADPANPSRWVWTAEAARRAILMRRLTDAGLSVQRASFIAEAVVDGREQFVEVGPGLWLEVAEQWKQD